MTTLRPIAADAPELAAALEAAQLPTEDLTAGGRAFFALDDAGQAVGYGGYELYGEDVLLRSVVVLLEQQRKGYGRAVTDAVLSQAAAAGARRAYLLTTTAEEFFVHDGFRPMDRQDAPASILSTKQATTICATATLLARRLA
jgi:N-acetylglutamate synthase-like GNAT family acetyltransferase